MKKTVKKTRNLAEPDTGSGKHDSKPFVFHYVRHYGDPVALCGHTVNTYYSHDGSVTADNVHSVICPICEFLRELEREAPCDERLNVMEWMNRLDRMK